MKRRTRKMIQAIIYVVVGFVFSVFCLYVLFFDVQEFNMALKIAISMVLEISALLGVCLVDYATTYIWKRIRERLRRIRERRN